MGKSQRNKGASYEREVANTINDTLNLPQHAEIKRHIGQARDGGMDLPIGPIAGECKRRKSLGTIENWLAQAEAAATEASRRAGEPRYPAVFARQDNGDSLIIMRLDDYLALHGAELFDMIVERAGHAGDIEIDLTNGGDE